MQERIVTMINAALDAFFVSIFEQFVQWYAGVIGDIMGMAQNVLDYPVVISAIFFAQGLAFALLSARVAVEAFQTWVLYANGDPEADPRGLLINTGKSVAVIAAMPWLVREIYIFGTVVALDVSRLGGAQGADVNFYHMITLFPGMAFIGAIGGILAFLLLLGIFIQTFIRAAHLGMLAVIGPVLAVQLISGGEMFSLWLKELLVVSFSQAIQIFMLLAAMYTLPEVAVGNPLVGLLMFLGWLWATVKAPSVLRQMAYSSGVGAAAGGAAQTAGSMIIMRKMMTRGV